MKKLFKVSTKAAIFDSTHEHILVIHMDHLNNWGLPGGHIEDNEAPDDAISRELIEECGLNPDSMQRKDFFMHSGGKIILAYVGEVNDMSLKSQQNNLEGIPKWLSLSKFQSIQIEPNYRNFVLENWPKK
ncbi:MAG TPA: NUDIX hydrolase [Candidatus Angelobacter sp.]|nr:NUDIX hydrolase [Candidatus Angelobacter sp.]